MTQGELLYLGLVLVGFVAFMATLYHFSVEQARIDHAAGIRSTASPNSGQHVSASPSQAPDYAHA